MIQENFWWIVLIVTFFEVISILIWWDKRRRGSYEMNQDDLPKPKQTNIARAGGMAIFPFKVKNLKTKTRPDMKFQCEINGIIFHEGEKVRAKKGAQEGTITLIRRTHPIEWRLMDYYGQGVTLDSVEWIQKTN